jgi:hypothetical protein
MRDVLARCLFRSYIVHDLMRTQHAADRHATDRARRHLDVRTFEVPDPTPGIRAYPTLLGGPGTYWFTVCASWRPDSYLVTQSCRTPPPGCQDGLVGSLTRRGP